jgi:alanine dehydrogenase
MKKGAVLVDVAIDQGGCFETSKETRQSNPTFVVDGVVHYAVSNMPGAVPKTSSKALTQASLPFVLELAEKGWRHAMRDNGAIRSGANVVQGKVNYEGISRALGMGHVPNEEVLLRNDAHLPLS